MCHVIDLSRASPFGDTQQIENRIMDYAGERLRKSIGGSPVNWESLISKGSIAEEIARMAEKLGVSLALAGNHGQSGFRRLVLGSVTERLMRILPCPLLVVDGPQHDFVSRNDYQIQLDRILVGCDFSPRSSLALQYALSLAREFGCELHLAHVLEATIYDDLVKSVAKSKEERERTLRRELKERLAQMVPAETSIGYSLKGGRYHGGKTARYRRGGGRPECGRQGQAR